MCVCWEMQVTLIFLINYCSISFTYFYFLLFALVITKVILFCVHFLHGVLWVNLSRAGLATDCYSKQAGSPNSIQFNWFQSSHMCAPVYLDTCNHTIRLQIRHVLDVHGCLCNWLLLLNNYFSCYICHCNNYKQSTLIYHFFLICWSEKQTESWLKIVMWSKLWILWSTTPILTSYVSEALV